MVICLTEESRLKKAVYVHETLYSTIDQILPELRNLEIPEVPLQLVTRVAQDSESQVRQFHVYQLRSHRVQMEEGEGAGFRG